MKKTDLSVFFHVSTSPEYQQKLISLKDNAPAAIPVITKQEMDPASNKVNLVGNQHYCGITAADPQDALDAMEASSRGKPVVLITLCETMMRAAQDRDISVITMGAPNPGVSVRRGYYPSEAQYLPNIMKMISNDCR